MVNTFEYDFIGYSPEYGTTSEISANDREHGEHKALQYVSEFYPELQDVEITACREIKD